MAIPLIVGALAVGTVIFGSKKAYDGYKTKEEAEEVLNRAKRTYDSNFKEMQENEAKAIRSLENLGMTQLGIVTTFSAFKKLSNQILKKLGKSENAKDTILNLPKHELTKIENYEASTADYLTALGGATASGAAAGFAVYGGVMTLAAASTGTPIAALSGAAAYNATMAAIGGGSLAAGGLGMAGGTLILGGAVAGPILAVGGWFYAKHAEKALENANKVSSEVKDVVIKLKEASKYFGKLNLYVDTIEIELNGIFSYFKKYFADLETIDKALSLGIIEAKNLEAKTINIVKNGYILMEILTSIMLTPLFKISKINDDGIEFMTDSDGFKIFNVYEMEEVIETKKLEIPKTTI